MSLAEIESELEKLTPDELRRLALKSWTTFVEKEGRADGANECSEDDPHLLAALDEAIARADDSNGQGHSASDVRARLGQWISR